MKKVKVIRKDSMKLIIPNLGVQITRAKNNADRIQSKETIGINLSPNNSPSLLILFQKGRITKAWKSKAAMITGTNSIYINVSSRCP
ncbi:hypothetical protein HDF25_003263 [Pedobacter cryoconitis]|uniref:Uncharacterized protein n=1 Tax=Pedobacter cryoconitis TaxID=188932 RepID=A0A7X0J4V0_9SPHI|nr:hypothetical protein [Pedobacter cryoconitis]